MKFKLFSLVLFVLALLSCEENTKQATFEVHDLAAPSGENSSLPYLFSNSDVTLLSWVEKENDSLSHLRFSEFKDGTWQDPNNIISGTDWFVNWADFPAIVENNGNYFSHVLKKSSGGTYSYDVKMNIKSKDAKEWKTDVALHSDGTPTEHGFVTALPYKENSFFVTWLDGRNTEEKEGEERGAMTIRAGVVASDETVSHENLLDSRTCDCCQTTAAITSNGPVVIYRDRSENELRDISIVRQVDGVWTAPKPIHNDNWKIKGCPVNGPKAAVLENTLAVGWFTAVANKPIVQVAFSENGGANFDKPIIVDSANVIGRVDIVLRDKETAIVSYMESEKGIARFKIAQVQRSGSITMNKIIAEMDGSRKSGFPQMELVDDKLLFAWTDYKDNNTAIKTSHVALVNKQ